MAGGVILVGAGPGDPGLFTVRGREVLAQAEVVVYDRLVDPQILALIPQNAIKIDAGKEAGRHPVPQSEINRMLVQYGGMGKRVVRLKGGDPFLFGRGGEELEALAEAGIPFEVVPGVTSALAAPAYGGIPVTHRTFGSSLHIITGHRRRGEPLEIDFEALVRAGGTLVFLMGVASLPEICAGLLAAGLDPNTPAAVIEGGTTPRQRRISAAAGNLAERAAECRVASPAVSVFGPVCALADQLDWFDALPLKGKRIVVTRPENRAGTLSQRLRLLGADVWECPCIRTAPIAPCPRLTEAVEALERYEWVVFTSPAGVEVFWDHLHRRGKDARALGGRCLGAIGPGTAEALKKHGLLADLAPEIYDGAHLGAALVERAGGRVLLPRAAEGGAALTQALERAGIPYDDIPIYRTVYETAAVAALQAAVAAGTVDAVTFTSASTVRGFLAAVGEEADCSKVLGVCIGEQTAAQARQAGIPVIIAEEATIDALIQAAEKAL